MKERTLSDREMRRTCTYCTHPSDPECMHVRLYLGVCVREESTGGGLTVEQVEVEMWEMTARASLRAACLQRTSWRCCRCSGDSSISSEQSPKAQSWARSSELMNSFTCRERACKQL